MVSNRNRTSIRIHTKSYDYLRKGKLVHSNWFGLPQSGLSIKNIPIVRSISEQSEYIRTYAVQPFCRHGLPFDKLRVN